MATEMTDIEKISINSEISAFDEAIKQNNLLRDRLEESRRLVESEALAIVDAMGLAFDAKTEHLERIRRFRHAAQNELLDLRKAIDSINKIANDVDLDNLMSKIANFSDSCSRIKELHDSGFLERLDLS